MVTKALAKAAPRVGEFEQSKDSGIERELDDDSPDRLSRVFSGLEERPRSPVEQHTEHQEEEVDVVQINGVGEPFLAHFPAKPQKSCSRGKNVETRPPVHPI